MKKADAALGSGSLNLLAFLRPDYVKLDISLAQGPNRDPYRAAGASAKPD